MFLKQEQWSCIKIERASSRTARQCHQGLQEACGESALRYRSESRVHYQSPTAALVFHPQTPIAMSRGAILSLALAAVVCCALADEMYTTKYDNVDVKEILSNPRLYHNYLKCLLGDSDAGCTPEGKELRRVIPDALKTRCSKCNEKQRATVKSVINGLRADHADDWGQLRAKWDPDNQYLEKYQDLLE